MDKSYFISHFSKTTCIYDGSTSIILEHIGKKCDDILWNGGKKPHSQMNPKQSKAN